MRTDALPADDPVTATRLTRRTLQRAFYLAAVEHLGTEPPWGMLSGVRPVKLPTRAMEAGATPRQAEAMLRDQYRVTPARRALAMDCAQASLAVKRSLEPQEISLYVGIPFCPTRCAYCSFISSSGSANRLIPAYLEGLFQEIDAAGAACQRAGKTVRSVYIGGGTPTTLSAAQLAQLLDRLRSAFALKPGTEFTVEAGRPDTITREKLEAIRNGGGNRISVNPQTMSDKVLAAVGRRHTARQTIEAFYQAVRAGFDDINMDLIAGLPDDDEEGFADSIRQVLALGPSNITVHTLALKKSAALFSSRAPLPPQEAVAAMLAGAEDALRDNGYEPYYLYRQKYMSGSFENTGWCRPGYTGLYNIYMMEELHTILSLGGGGMNKINLPAEKLARYHNPKIPQDYISRIDTILQQKDEIFSLLRQIREQNP